MKSSTIYKPHIKSNIKNKKMFIIKNFYLLFLIIYNINSYGQSQNSQFLPALPLSTEFEHIKHIDLFVGKNGSELFFAKIDDNTTLPYLKTENYPDCLFAVNNFNGFDVYKKLSGKFQRVIQIKKVDGTFKAFFVDNRTNNISRFILSADEKDGNTGFTAALSAYTYYWNFN